MAAALLAALGTVPHAARAATIIVTTSSDSDSGTASGCTLRQAVASMNTGAVTGIGCVNSGNAFGAGDTILFGTSPFPLGGTNTITLATGQISITAPHLTIDATANGSVTIDANHLSRVMNDSAASGGSLTLRHLTLRNGSVTASDCHYAQITGPEGGAICIGAASLTLSNSTLSGNSAPSGKGGGIFCYSGSVALNNSTLIGNSGGSAGGGIFCSNVTLINSTLSGNSASLGGGIYALTGNVTLTDTTLSGNTAKSKGGGIFGAGYITLTNSTLSGNSASLGGGIAITGSTDMWLTNSTLSGNSAAYGGGIDGKTADPASITLTNSTISANTATSDGGGIDLYSSIDNLMTIDNSIVAGNAEGGSVGDVRGIVTSSSFSLIGGNPILGALANNGGPTQTMLPQAGSPAIDAMLCSHAPSTDQRGYVRPDPGSEGSPTLCDIGSVETGSIPDEIFRNGFDP